MGLGSTGKLGRAWVGAWVDACMVMVLVFGVGINDVLDGVW